MGKKNKLTSVVKAGQLKYGHHDGERNFGSKDEFYLRCQRWTQTKGVILVQLTILFKFEIFEVGTESTSQKSVVKNRTNNFYFDRVIWAGQTVVSVYHCMYMLSESHIWPSFAYRYENCFKKLCTVFFIKEIIPNFFLPWTLLPVCKFSPFDKLAVKGYINVTSFRLPRPFSKVFVPPYLNQGCPEARIHGDLAIIAYTIVTKMTLLQRVCNATSSSSY